MQILLSIFEEKTYCKKQNPLKMNGKTYFCTNLYFNYYKNDTKKCKFITDFELILFFL